MSDDRVTLAVRRLRAAVNGDDFECGFDGQSPFYDVGILLAEYDRLAGAAQATSLENLADRFVSIIQDGMAQEAGSKSIASIIINELLMLRIVTHGVAQAPTLREGEATINERARQHLKDWGGDISRFNVLVAFARKELALAHQPQGGDAREAATIDSMIPLSASEREFIATEIEKTMDESFYKKRAEVRVALAVAAGIVRRGRRLTSNEQLANLANAMTETCSICEGSGYSNHPDSNEVCGVCKGTGSAPSIEQRLEAKSASLVSPAEGK